MDIKRLRSTRAAACVAITLALGCGGGEDDELAPAYTTVPASADGGANDDDGGDEGETEGDAAADDDGDTDDDGSATGDAGDDAGGDDAGPAGTGGPADGGDDAPPPADSGPVDDGGADDAADDAGGPAAECLAQATNECETCACNTCLSQLQACEQDPGCVAIRMCAQQNMCTGIGCLGPCGAVIDEHGGAFGPSAGLASMLSDCVEGGCPAC